MDGTFTLEIFAFEKTSDDEEGAADENTPQFSKETALLSGSKTGLSIVGDTIEIDGTIALVISSTEPGTVSLKIKVPDGCSLYISEANEDGTPIAESEARFIVTGDSPNFTVTQKDKSGISTGAYQMKFTVKKGDEIVHIFSEYINVINGLCTDTWSGSEKGEAKEISQSMISSTVYVRGTDGWYDKPEHYKDTATASDSNSGSFLSPFKTIQKAIDKVIAINDGASAYTIYVDGTFIATDTTYFGTDGMADFSKCNKNLTLTIKALSGTATLDANKLSRVINAKPESGALNLTLENLTLTGGNTSENGGGIYFGSTGGTLTISDDTTIKGNIASGNGGNVYLQSGTFEMEGGTISGGNAKYGGGVYINGGKFTMNDGTIGNNKASSSGGGVYVNSNNRFEMSGGTISGNEATSNGGGVYGASSSTFTMSGGAISGNKASKGKGAFISLTSLNMSGSARFAGSDDVYLHASGSDSSTIIVAGPLTATNPVATITLSAYTANRRVLSKSTDVTITQDICKQFELTPDPNGGEWKIVPDSSGANGVLKSLSFYVRGSNAPWYAANNSSATANDTNAGDLLHPFATIQKAVDTVIEQNDGSSKYTIYVDGTLSATITTYIGTYGMADFSALDKNLNLTIKALSGTATLDAGARLDENGNIKNEGIKKRVISGATSNGCKLNLTLENLVIMGANMSLNRGGGIYFYSSGGALTMKDCTVSGNIAHTGGGVGIMDGSFTMKDGVISGNAATYGGGVYVYISTFTMESGTIEKNHAQLGGGAYFTKKFIMNGGTISENTASENGGGVYKESSAATFNKNGGTVTGNTPNDVYN